MNGVLRTLRLNRGLTVKEAAQRMGVPTTTLAAAERGERKPDPGNALAIASFYGQQVTDIWPVQEQAA